MPQDALSAASINKNLGTRVIGQKVIYYPRLVSTMDTARKAAQQGAPEGTVIIAGEQTGGRGRLGRTWMSPQGNIALSLILYPDLSSLPNLIMLASVAVARTIEALTGLKTQVKWPNDILINGKKVCGILIENEVKGSRVVYAIIGIGINVGLKPADSPGIAEIATGINIESGRKIPRVDIIRTLLGEIEKLYLSLPQAELVYLEWRDRLITLGKRVVVVSDGDSLTGVAESVAGDGSLLLRLSDGNSRIVVAGDVTLRVPEAGL